MNRLTVPEFKLLCEYALKGHAAEKLARPEEQAKWIPVGERLPEVATAVLIVVKDHAEDEPYVEWAERRRSGAWYLIGGDLELAEEVSHWMPAPSLPQPRAPA